MLVRPTYALLRIWLQDRQRLSLRFAGAEHGGVAEQCQLRAWFRFRPGSTLAPWRRGRMPTARGAVAAVTAPPLVLAGLGLTHPDDLTGVSAGWWTSLHIILVPLFPLLGVSHWILLHGRPGVIVGSAGSQPSSNARLETLLGHSTSGTRCLRRPSVAMGR